MEVYAVLAYPVGYTEIAFIISSTHDECTTLVLFLVDEIADLRERISNLEREKDSEKASYEQQLQQLRAECKDAKDQLIADNMMKGK